MSSPISKIDVTPLIGVALILVIVFMVTSPMMMTATDMDVELPKAKTIEPESEVNITISISKDHKVALNEKHLPLKNLNKELKLIIAEHPDRLVVIRADKNVRHDSILQLLSIAKKAGAKKLALATLQRNRERV